MKKLFNENIQTERLVLSRAGTQHAEAIFEAYTQDERVTKFLGWRPHKSVEDSVGFLSHAEKELDAGSSFPFVIATYQEPQDVIGMIDAHPSDHAVHFGYVLKFDAWGMGYAAEALHALVDLTLAHPDIFRAYAFCDAENLASARVMEKAGMEYEGVLKRWFIHPNISDEPRDCKIYARVK